MLWINPWEGDRVAAGLQAHSEDLALTTGQSIAGLGEAGDLMQARSDQLSRISDMIVSRIEGSAEQLHRKKDDLSKVSGEAAGLLEDVTERMHQAGLQLNESGEAGVANVDGSRRAAT